MFNKKKKYFRQKLRGVESMIWDMEFKRSKTQMIREEVRQEYDNRKSKLAVVEAQIKAQAETPTMAEGDIARLNDDKVLFERDIGRFEERMKGLDMEVAGTLPTNDYPDGVQGINDQLDALRALVGMLKEYIKGL